MQVSGPIRKGLSNYRVARHSFLQEMQKRTQDERALGAFVLYIHFTFLEFSESLDDSSLEPSISAFDSCSGDLEQDLSLGAFDSRFNSRSGNLTFFSGAVKGTVVSILDHG
ncbi:uncharacterized protein LOC143862599 [Tasmannia lanceolata]|uniref:uncharacterized protein LOC143862599 n=1 Tax=Tasmannia lanceolata TaxID=3420 RepID=UPI0040631D84